MYTAIIDKLLSLEINLTKLKTKDVNKINKIPSLVTDVEKLTDFITYDASLKERLITISHRIVKQPTCKSCDTPVRMTTSGVKSYSFPPFCGRKCASSHTSTNTKRKNTVQSKYNVDNVFQSEQVKNKITQTLTEKYGVTHPSHSPTIRDKANNTLHERYGVYNAAHSPVLREKKKQTNIHKYGVDNPRKSELVIDKIRKTNQLNFGRSFPNQTHLTEDSIQKLNDKEWLYYNHITKSNTLGVLAQTLKCNQTTVGRHLAAHNIPTQYFYQSTGEKEVGAYIKSKNIQIQEGRRDIISPYELDIYIPDHNLAIEYCGLYWHSEQQGKDKHYHKRKHDMCKALGIQLLTIYEDEWMQQKTQIQNKLLSLLNISSHSIYARQTNIKNVNTKDKVLFFNNHHIQGNGPGSIHIGLYCDNDMVSCMSFIKQKNDVYYVNRYATSCRVIGGFSKLLKYFKTNYEWKTLISFADQRWSDGNLYEQTGWTLDTIIPSDYYYSPDGVNRFHKFNYRRKNLPKLLKDFDPNLSERQNCINNGVLRIWDCGKLRYVQHAKAPQ